MSAGMLLYLLTSLRKKIKFEACRAFYHFMYATLLLRPFIRVALPENM